MTRHLKRWQLEACRSVYPHLWTVPFINFPIRTYGLIMGVGFVIALLIVRRRAKFANLSVSAMTSVVLIGMIGGLIGGPVMYRLHYKTWGGREVLGGVVLGIVFGLVYLIKTRKSILSYLDAAIPALVLAMGIGRLGCLMFGCCYGSACQTANGDRALPWAVRFPYGSVLYEKERGQGDLAIPQSLLWRLPKQETREPIPPRVLEMDIDADEALKTWAAAAYRLSELREGDQQSPEFEQGSKAYTDAKKALGQRDPLALFAAAHLKKLNAKSDAPPTTWGDLRELSKQQHTRWVHPTQLYDFVALLLLFGVLSFIFWQRPRPGTVLIWAMILYPINRVIQEAIRSDNPHDMVWGLTISQFASVAIFVLGVLLAIGLRMVVPKRTVPNST